MIPKSNNAMGADLEDGSRPMSPASQPQPSIKQELDHHLPDFHDNISLPVSIFFLYNYLLNIYNKNIINAC